MRSPSVALTIAGSDSSAGAGIQADLKAFTACGVYGLTVATAIVAERPGSVISIAPVAAKSIRDQLEAVLPHYPVAAIKTGLLPSADAISAVRDALRSHQAPLVIDPVAIASTGTALASPSARAALLDLIRERAGLITPNRAEAEYLLGQPLKEAGQARAAAESLQKLFGCAVLLKGGHFEGPDSIDWLATGDGKLAEAVAAPRIPDSDVHGTGCTYSAAITGRLALGMPLVEAVWGARLYLQSVLTHHSTWFAPDGSGIKALAHVAEP